MNAVTPEKIRSDAEHAIRVGRTYLLACERFGIDLRKARVLELGAGWNLGAALMMGTYGAHVVAVDPGMTSWQESYHRPFYECMLRLLAVDMPWSRLDLFRQVLRPGGYPPERVTPLRTVGERLDAVASESIDFTCSNAVLEHVRRIPVCFQELHRVTKPGGCGAHQIDMRDHRSVERPLDYLLLSEDAFIEHVEARDGNTNKNANRMRQKDFVREFGAAGFGVDAVEQNRFSEPGYRQEVEERLRVAGIPFIDEDVRVLSARYYVQKRSSEATQASEWCRMGPAGDRLSVNAEQHPQNAERAQAFIDGTRRLIARAERREAVKEGLKAVPGLHAAVRAVKRLRR